MSTKLRGKWGEACTADYLTRRGYKIVAAGYKSRFGEIDLIAENRKYLAFVEVKLRKNDQYGAAQGFVTAAKQQRIAATAMFWLQENPTEKQPRFDVAAIYAPPGAETRQDMPDIDYIENAFEVNL